MPVPVPAPRPTILLVDDTPDILMQLSTLLFDDYQVKIATCGRRALEIAQDRVPDIILLDIEMPGMDGYDVCRALKEQPVTRDIPVLMLTAHAHGSHELEGLNAGTADYLTKPVSPAILKLRLNNHLRLSRTRRFLSDRADLLEHEVQRRTTEVTAIQDATICALASLAETRDNETGYHIRRTQHYVRLLARQLAQWPRDGAALTPRMIDMLYKSAPLHDIGKVGVPDAILLKPGKLTPAEYEIMKRHAELGRDAIARAEQMLGTPIDFLRIAKEIAYGHHEKWDGSGYPQGLAGEAIPLSARLMAVADVYDALISRRVYKEGMPADVAEGIILDGTGTHFDPVVVAAFAELREEFRAIAARYADSASPTHH
jgi:putative two-component system response regulator